MTHETHDEHEETRRDALAAEQEAAALAELKLLGQSTQSEHPLRATLRTVAVILLVGLPVANTALGIVGEELAGSGLDLGGLTAVVNAGIAGTALLAGIVQRIALIPAVNDLLTRLGVGPVDRDTNR